jgi:hypothetical protein
MRNTVNVRIFLEHPSPMENAKEVMALLGHPSPMGETSSHTSDK